MGDNEGTNPSKKRRVKSTPMDHSYHDYANEPITAGNESEDRRLANFPAKLHWIISSPEYQHIICWMPHGRSWFVKDKHLVSFAFGHIRNENSIIRASHHESIFISNVN